MGQKVKLKKLINLKVVKDNNAHRYCPSVAFFHNNHNNRSIKKVRDMELKDVQAGTRVLLKRLEAKFNEELETKFQAIIRSF